MDCCTKTVALVPFTAISIIFNLVYLIFSLSAGGGLYQLVVAFFATERDAGIWQVD